MTEAEIQSNALNEEIEAASIAAQAAGNYELEVDDPGTTIERMKAVDPDSGRESHLRVSTVPGPGGYKLIESEYTQRRGDGSVGRQLRGHLDVRGEDRRDDAWSSKLVYQITKDGAADVNRKRKIESIERKDAERAIFKAARHIATQTVRKKPE